MKAKKVIVFGLDGASFELLNKFGIENFPNIKKVMKKGVYSDMKVCLPPVTSPNWKCYSTGKNPGKLGIFWWENIDVENEKVVHPRNRFNNNKEIWDYLNDKNIPVGVMNMATTYPPKKIKEFLISGNPDAGSNYTYPKKLKKELKEKFDYRIITPKANPDIYSKREISNSIFETIDMRFKAFKYLYKKYPNIKFFHLSIFHINTLQHNYWDHEYTKKGWKIIDKHIEEFVEDPEVDLIFMSDHGSHKIDYKFNINTWLEDNGYLKTKKSKEKNFLSQSKIAKVIKKMGIDPMSVKPYIPQFVMNLFPEKSGEVKKEEKTDAVDWNKTKALASGQGPVYIKKENVENYKEFREKLKGEIEKIKNPKTDRKIAKNVYFKEELYSGKYLKEAPDLIIDTSRGVFISGGIGKKDLFEKPKKWKGENKPTGFFMAQGPDFKKNKKIKNMHILDIAPTILNLFNIKKPKDLDGEVKNEFLVS